MSTKKMPLHMESGMDLAFLNDQLQSFECGSQRFLS